MKVLVTGAGGQVGSEIAGAFPGDAVAGYSHADLDVTDPAAVHRAFAAAGPDLVVHAAAFTKVDACETEVDTAWQVNAYGSWNVARACSQVGAALVYLSTDYVFDGTASRPYTEFDPVAPLSMYGRTKQAGEQLVRETLARSFIVRTSWVQGATGANFVKTMLRLGRDRGAVSVVDDQTGSPTFAADLAAAVRALVGRDRPGTYHLTNAGSCTWYEFAQAVFAGAGMDVEVAPIDTATFGAPAPRPANSVLDNRKAALLGLEPLPDWQVSLARLLEQLDAA